ncbi:adenine phosphoribosyltransferase [Thiomicrorhabdus lithotrophica]|uniref:Adenine phosphoribosyltransferase n=1 Tax=Thiomicrorhabdus lithotrophica TaxID=2949997 RepID=A0ABY8CDP0_9GAMM|nr:adenine phosphoribosyltransferase [Thiomicrorhabdus lithotrophica]WEJ62790.1 adenine phosphoribosyltransferase [Thiomicrorhabdus lithotrophica]
MAQHPLAQYLEAVPDFPKPGIVFSDISPLLKSHFTETIDAMSALFTEAEWAEIDCLAGIESRGFIFAAALAYKYNKGFIKVRKPGKLPNVAASIEYGLEYGSDKLEMQKGDGSKIVLLDDLIATGGSMGAAASLCEQVGYDVVGMACLIDLASLNSFTYNDMTVRSVIQFSD